MQFPILGIDFLRHYHLVVDAAGGQLVDARSLRAFPAASSVSRRDGRRGVFSCIGGTPPPFRQLLVDYQDVLNPSGRLPPTTHGVEHHLPTTGRPVTARFRRLDPVMHAAAKASFEDMERQGIVRRSSSCWASPLHMVKKADGTWRPCGDFRRLNLITEPDKYPLPRMDDLAASLSGCKFFSKLDLKQGYHQIPMREEDIKKTAIITPFGLFEYTRMPFGLRNSGQTFQRLMDRVLAGLEGVFCYLDNILVASPDSDSHRRHLQQLFDRLREYGLVLNANKCVFGQPAVEFLGHSVTGDGAAPLEDKTAAIRAFPRPTTVKELQGFLGKVNFHRRFIPGAAKILAPLTDALKGGGKGSAAIGWSPAMEAAFLSAKASLVSAATLAHPSPSAELGLMVDASSTHVGASLQQRRGGGAWEPLGFFSRKLNTAQSKYSAFDRELWAVFSGYRFFRFILEGREFAVFTDHKPLTSALKRVSEPWTARQQRHLAYIAEYTSDLRHIAGVDNVVADTLSRPPPPEKAAAAAAAIKPGCVKAPPGSQPAPPADHSWRWRRRRPRLIMIGWLESSQAALQLRRPCPPLPWRSALLKWTGSPCCATSPAVRSGCWWLNLVAGQCSWRYTPLRTLGCVLPDGCWQAVLSGQAWRQISPPGAKTARTVLGGKPQSTSPPRWNPLRYPVAVSRTCTWTWLALSPRPRTESHTSSPL